MPGLHRLKYALILVLMLGLALPVLAVHTTITVTITGRETAEFGYNGSCGGRGFTNAVTPLDFTVDAGGRYTFELESHTSSTDSAFIAIYEDRFDATDTTINCIGGITFYTPITVELVPGTTYVLVSATGNGIGTGTVTTAIDGPGSLCVEGVGCTRGIAAR